MINTALLQRLADGRYHSGQALADASGVSRTAIWKQVEVLAAQGIAIERERGRGYRIAGGLELLDADRILGALSPVARSLLRELHILPGVDSTNAELQRRAGAGAGTVCTAEQQSAGRGRRGRHWVSPFARNLYVSVLWEFERGAASLEGLSLAVGVTAATALEQIGVADVRLKWPNDLLVGDAKLGGILLEMSGDAAGLCQVVIGIGINVAMPSESAMVIDQEWTDVARSLRVPADDGGGAPPLLRNRLLATLLNALLPALPQFAQQGFAPFRDAWLARDAHRDAPVMVVSEAAQLAGIARGVSERGALQLHTATGLQEIWGGEVSLRSARHGD